MSDKKPFDVKEVLRILATREGAPLGPWELSMLLKALDEITRLDARAADLEKHLKKHEFTDYYDGDGGYCTECSSYRKHDAGCTVGKVLGRTPGEHVPVGE